MDYRPSTIYQKVFTIGHFVFTAEHLKKEINCVISCQ